ncbi:recombinase family protein [Patescibacteria group bacterium]
MKQKTTKINYFLYARKSSESEDRQVASIESQIKELTKIARRDGLKIVEVLSESQSAKAPGRPVFNKMVERINNDEAQGIICWKLDRLARNPIDGGSISWMLQQGIIKHIQTHGRSHFPTDNVLMMAVELGMANQFIRELSENTKRGLKSKAERGWYPTRSPIGYTHNPLKKKGEKEISKDPERFYLVKKMFVLMLAGNYKPPQILKIANKKWGLTAQNGRQLARSTIYRVFTNPFYSGKFEFPKGSGDWIQGKHEPMITEDEYDKIQLLLGNKGKSRPKSHVFAFTGLIRCKECGAMITAEERLKLQKNKNVHRYIYYHCTKRKNPDCSQGSIEEKELSKQIVDILGRIEIPKEFYNWVMKKFRSEIKDEVKDRNRILNNQQRKYNNCVREIDGLISMRAKGELDEEDYKRRMLFLSKGKERLQELLNDTDYRVNKSIVKANEVFAFARDAKKKFETGALEEKRIILANLGSNLTLKDKKLSILIEKPLILIEKAVPEIKAIHKQVRTSPNRQNEREFAKFYSKSRVLLRE